ncbi:MAG: DAK2 domain-containing protein [Anaerolineae bacterium]|nr:DAK2 domain-containing protein [Anaerolineae bacterium]MDQ7034835.1 DAK2 domain-containing protein [Anaerolineae bacterium]
MVVEVRSDTVDGKLLTWMLGAGVHWLDYHKDQVNDMNVFPVPDGDTGTNMLLTIRNAYQQVAHLEEHHVGIIFEQIARGALIGARGNSGTILSMLLRGFSQAIKDKEVLDADAFVQGCQSAVDYAYETVRSVMEPVEGTILTVARESAAALKEHARDESHLKVLLSKLIVAAYKSLENTPNLLPKLKEAGVVDSGGMGLVYILEGMQRFLDGEPVTFEDGGVKVAVVENEAWQDALVPDDEEGYGYDVQFLMLGKKMDVKQIRQDISAMGWSPLIDGGDSLIKVHIHVHNPGEPLTYAIGLGVDLDDIVVENMQAQYLQYVQDRSERESNEGATENNIAQVKNVAVITVARGAGLEKLLSEYGAARVIVGGQTMNPSTEDFLTAMESLDAKEIVLLPNNGNVIMAAQQAATLIEGRKVRVVPSKTVQQGITALLAYMDMQASSSLDGIFNCMCEHLGQVVSGEVTTAVRDTTYDGLEVQTGDNIGLLNGKMKVSRTSVNETVQALLHEARAADYELITLYYGEGVGIKHAEALAGKLEDEFNDLEFEVVYGGQPLYPYLISIE